MNETATLIATSAGVAITLALAYVPGLAAWWEEREGAEKRLALAILYLATSAGMYLPSCWGGPQLVECSTASVWDVVMAFFMALISSQGMYTLLPAPDKARMSSWPERARHGGEG